MVDRTNFHPEVELRHHDRKERERQYSYDLTKQLTFFVISAELVFCGYILLNAPTLKDVGHSSTLFVLAGLAAIFGIVWRLVYNEIYHAIAHGRSLRSYYYKIRTMSYWFYVGLSLIFFVLLLIVGYAYLSAIEEMGNSQANGLVL